MGPLSSRCVSIFFSGGAFSWFSLQRHLIRDLWFSDPLFPFWSCLLGLFVVVLAAAFSVCLVSFFLSLIFRLPSSIIVSASFSTHHSISTPLYCCLPLHSPDPVLCTSSRLQHPSHLPKYTTTHTLICSIFSIAFLFFLLWFLLLLPPSRLKTVALA